MKILVVTNMYPTPQKPQWGTFVFEQVESFRKKHAKNVKIDVYLIDGSESKINYLKAFFDLPVIVRRGKYDFVHVHYGLTLLAALLVTAPVIVTWHGSDLLGVPGKYLSKVIKYKASHSIVVSQNLYDALGTGTIIPCGINVNEFLLSQKQSKNWSVTQKKELKILFPSNPNIKVKNYPLFFEVCRELEKKGYKIIEEYLVDLPRKLVPNLFWNSDVMLVTSLSEGSPTVVKEAIAAKLPFVSVDVGDVSQWCELVDFGVVVKSRKAKEIASTILKLLEKQNDRAVLRNEKALKKIDNDVIAIELMKVYLDLLT